MKVKITGRRYAETANYYRWDADKEYPYFEEVEEQTWEINTRSLRDGERWLAKNHPDMLMGGNVNCENGDFACFPVPCEEYGTGNYETVDARIACVKAMLVKGII